MENLYDKIQAFKALPSYPGTANEGKANLEDDLIKNIDVNFMELDVKMYPIQSPNNDIDKLYIVDSFGNVLCSFDKNGINAQSFNIVDNNGVFITNIDVDGLSNLEDGLSNLENINDVLHPTFSNTFNFCDASGNIIMTVGEDGIKASNMLNTYKNEIAGKEIYSIGDSLSTLGVWQSKLAELSGSVFDNAKNTDASYPLSYGGTRTLSGDINCAHIRVQNLLLYDNVSVIFIENINDMNSLGTKGVDTDKEFFMSKLVDYPSIFSDIDTLNSWLTTGFASFLSTIPLEERTLGYSISFSYYDIDGITVLKKTMCFTSFDILDFENTGNYENIVNITMWSSYKGLVSFLKKNFPTADIYMISPTRFGFDFNDPLFLNANGSVNAEYYYSTNGYLTFNELVNFQSEFCEKVGIQHINLHKNAGITIWNCSEYYPSSNVHPYDKGYELWGKKIFKYI